MAEETTSVAISKAHRFEIEDWRETKRAEDGEKPTVRSVVEDALDEFLEKRYTDLNGGDGQDNIQGESASSVGTRDAE